MSLRHVTDLDVLSRYLRGIDEDTTGVASRVHDPYAQILSIFRGVNIAAGALARVPFEIWDTVANEPLLPDTVGSDGPRARLLRLFARPNPVMTWRKFIETAIVQYHSGNAYVYTYEPDIYGVPTQLRLLLPSSVLPYREAGDDVMELRGWQFSKTGGGVVILPTDKVLRLEYAVNPQDPHRGLGPFTPGRLAADADYLAGTYQRATLMNGGAPGSILSFDGDEDELPREQADQLEESWQRKFGAASSGSKVALLTGKWNYQVLGFRPRDMEFLAQRKFSLEEFARLLNIPPLYLGVYENSGLSDAGLRVQQRLLYENNTIPLAVKVAELLNESIIKLVDPTLEGVFNFDTVEALRDDLQTKATIASTLVQAGWSNTEVNERLDLGFDTPDEEIDGVEVEQEAAPPPLAQFTASIQQIVKDVASGALPRDAGLGLLVVTLGMTQEQAELVLGSAGIPEEPAAAPPPPPPNGDMGDAPAGADAPVADPGAEGAADDDSPSDGAAPEEMAPAIVEESDGWYLVDADGQHIAGPFESEDEARAQSDAVGGEAAIASRAVSSLAVVRAARGKKLSASRIKKAHRAYLRAQQQAEHAIENKVRSTLMSFRAGVLRKLVRLNAERGGAGARAVLRSADDDILRISAREIAELLDEIDEAKLRAAITPGIRRAYRSGAASLEDVMDAIGVPARDYTRFQEDRLPAIVDGFIDKRLGTGLPTSVTDDIRDAVNEAVVEAIQNGSNLKTTIDGIRDVFDSSLSRARTIARTETAIAMSSARQIAYSEQGVDRHQWLTAGDEHVREEHALLDGTITDVGEEFMPGLRYPGDPDCPDAGLIINCRCTTVPLSRRGYDDARAEGAPTATEQQLALAQEDDDGERSAGGYSVATRQQRETA